MARTSHSKPTSTGPGRGSPRSRTAARPGERASKGAGSARPVKVAPNEAPVTPAAPAARSRAFGLTWRLIAMMVVLAVIALTLTQSLRVYFTQASQIATLRAEIDAENERIADLEDQIARWDDPAYVKAQARERLGWVMPGETGYRVVDADGNPVGTDEALVEPESTDGQWWQDVWGSVAVADNPAAYPDPSATPSPDAGATITPDPSPTTSG